MPRKARFEDEKDEEEDHTFEFPSSSILIPTPVPSSEFEPRHFYLQHAHRLSPPWIAHSPFVPPRMVEHLMRRKKDEAIGVKFVPSKLLDGWHGHRKDEITNMEGAMHTFVIPIAQATMHGVYAWKGRHGINSFGDDGRGRQLGMTALISALVQPDFERGNVMMALCKLERDEVIGQTQMPPMLSVDNKQHEGQRAEYDAALRRYMLYHLLPSHHLPPAEAVRETAYTIPQLLSFLTQAIQSTPPHSILSSLTDVYFHCSRSFLSLQLVYAVILAQVTLEHTLLNRLVDSSAGYVYTWNPPSIFAEALGPQGTELLSLILVLALKQYGASTFSTSRDSKAGGWVRTLQSCKAIAWDNFATPAILPLLRTALRESQPQIHICSTVDIFPRTPLPPPPSGGPGGGGGRGAPAHLPYPVHPDEHIMPPPPPLSRRASNRNPFFLPPHGCNESILVLHNNSDAFGQNVETEGGMGSLDAVIGANSSLAASLERGRGDLCERRGGVW